MLSSDMDPVVSGLPNGSLQLQLLFLVNVIDISDGVGDMRRTFANDFKTHLLTKKSSC